MKKQFYFLATLVFSGLLLMQCKSDTAKESTTADVTPTAATANFVELYSVYRENFRLRDKPELAAAKIGLLSSGDFVQYLGETSKEKIAVQLDNLTYTEPFYKVKTLTADGTDGWIHGTGILCVFNGPKSQQPDMASLGQFAKYLGALPLKNLESGQKALEFCQTSLKNTSPQTADALYILLEKFLSTSERQGSFYNLVEGKIVPSEKEWKAIYAGTFDMNKTPDTKKLAAAGFRMNAGEGMLFPTVDYAKLNTLFAPTCSAPMKAYLKLQAEADKNRTSEDGGVVLPLKELVNRTIQWENFVEQNPNFALKSAKSDAAWLRFMVLCGADNTPVFDYDTRMLSPGFKEAWAYTLATYPKSALAAEIKVRQSAIDAAGGKVTEEVQKICGKMAEESW